MNLVDTGSMTDLGIPDPNEGATEPIELSKVHPLDQKFAEGALYSMMLGGIVLAFSSVVALPGPLLLAGGVLVLLGLLLVPFLGYRGSRRQGHPIPDSILRGLWATWVSFWKIVF